MIKAEEGKITLRGDKAELATDFVMIVQSMVEEDEESFNYTKDEIDMLVKMVCDRNPIANRLIEILNDKLTELLEGLKGED